MELGSCQFDGCLFMLMFTIEKIKKLIAEGRLDKFYNDRAWRRLSEEIKTEQRECQYCKAKGKVGAADVVHHVKHLKQRPDLAYSRFYTDDRGTRHRQLVACCFMCHNIQHPEKHRGFRVQKNVEHFKNEEKW